MAIWMPAFDNRIKVSVSNCGCVNYKNSIAREVGIQMEFCVPNIMNIGDIEDIVVMAAPTPLFISASDNDKWSKGAQEIYDYAKSAFPYGALKLKIWSGGHIFTKEMREEAYSFIGSIFKIKYLYCLIRDQAVWRAFVKLPLMGRYGVCEYELDQLLRNEVFVDLYKIVKSSLLLGEPRYSIKNVEHLYRNKRETAVESGGDSVVFYEQWGDLHNRNEEGKTWETSTILKNIRDYNIDDCNSTQELVVWLREQQQANNISYLGKTEINEPELKEEVTQRITLRDRLLEKASQELSNNPKQAALSGNMAWMLEFHRRESKPLFWRLFDRLGLIEEELFDDLDCLAFCQ